MRAALAIAHKILVATYHMLAKGIAYQDGLDSTVVSPAAKFDWGPVFERIEASEGADF